MKYRELYEKALEAMPRAYAPFKVGAALLTKDGEVFTGVNVENSSLGATICAERTAFVKAVSEGATEFEAIAVVSEEGEVWPCGICRQFMKEFCDDDFRVITGNDVDSLRLYTMDEILPEGFKL